MQKKPLFLLSLAHMSADLNSGALPALVSFFVVAFGYTFTEAATIMFCYALIASIVQPVFGYIADRKPSMWYLPIGVLLVGVSVGSLGFMPSYVLICLFTMLSGFGNAIFHPVAAGYANILAGKQRATGMSIFSIGGNAGFAMGPVLAGFLLPLCGMHGTAFFGILAILTSITIARALSNVPVPGRKDTQASDASNDWRAFGCLSGVIISRAVVFNGVNAFIALYWMKYFGVDEAGGAFILAFFCAAGVVCNLVGGWLSDRLGYVRILKYTQCFMLPAVLCFSLSDNVWLAGILLFAISFALYASFSPTVILGQTYLAKNIGFSAGVTMGLARTAGGIAMPLMGLIADAWGLRTAFLCMAAVVVVGIIAAWHLKAVK